MTPWWKRTDAKQITAGIAAAEAGDPPGPATATG
jgi:hypothetical protein